MCIETCQSIFSFLRQRDGITPETLYKSLNPMDNQESIKAAKEGMGKSGSFFFFSADRRLVLKTIKPHEIVTLKKQLKRYYKHIHNNGQTLLCKIYGLYTFDIEGVERMSVVLIENSQHYLTKKSIIRTYDVKGSIIGRQTDPALKKNADFYMKFFGSSLNEENFMAIHGKDYARTEASSTLEVPLLEAQDTNERSPLYKRYQGILKDLDFLAIEKNNVSMPYDDRDNFFNIMIKDLEFLKKCNLLDYSLLLTISKENIKKSHLWDIRCPKQKNL